MKFHCHRPTLAAALGILGGVVPVRTTKDILRNVRLTAADDKLTLAGTDSEVSMSYVVSGVEVEVPGEVLLPAQRATTILREMTNERVSLTHDDGMIHIASGQSQFDLSPENAEEFPTIKDFDGDSYFTLPAATLREAIRRTIFAADSESTRYALGGVMIEPTDSGLTFAATDSRRLAVYETNCERVGEPGSGPDSGAVVPIKALSTIERILATLDEEDTAQISLHTSEAFIKCGSGVVVSRLVDGRFPKYRQVIPAESPIEIPMVAGEFNSAVRQAQILTSDDNRGVDFVFEDGTLTLQSQAADIGASEIALPIDYSGERLTITFDPKFVGDVLRVVDPVTSFTLHLTDGDKQVLMKVGSNYRYVIMPLSRDRAR